MKIKFFALITMFSVFLSCAATSPAKKPALPGKNQKSMDYKDSALAYFPLSVGNSWTYSVNYLGESGKMKVVIEKEENGWFVDNRGHRMKADKRGIRDKDRYLLRFPLHNQRWVSILSPSQKEVSTVTEIDKSVTVPAGNFPDTVVTMTEIEVEKGKTLYFFRYFAAQVGIIKIVSMLEDTKSSEKKIQTVTELEKYEIKGQKN
ncbi:MAG: hypothetical protein R6W70_10365 [bacterium]